MQAESRKTPGANTDLELGPSVRQVCRGDIQDWAAASETLVPAAIHDHGDVWQLVKEQQLNPNTHTHTHTSREVRWGYWGGAALQHTLCMAPRWRTALSACTRSSRPSCFANTSPGPDPERPSQRAEWPEKNHHAQRNVCKPQVSCWRSGICSSTSLNSWLKLWYIPSYRCSRANGECDPWSGFKLIWLQFLNRGSALKLSKLTKNSL